MYIHSFIYSGHFYSTSSSPLLLISAPDTARILCRSFTPKRHNCATVSEGLAQGPYVAARAGFEPTTLRTKGIDSTKAPTCPTYHMYYMSILYVRGTLYMLRCDTMKHLNKHLNIQNDYSLFQSAYKVLHR